MFHPSIIYFGKTDFQVLALEASQTFKHFAYPYPYPSWFDSNIHQICRYTNDVCSRMKSIQE